MIRDLFSEICSLYVSNKKNPNVIHVRMRMQDMTDENVLRHAVDTTMKRYPYFAVELTKKDDRYVFESNERPVTVVRSESGVELNSEASNFHMLAVSWFDDCIVVNISHALTDGTGTYRFLRTLLYYYCSEYYDVELDRDGVCLVGDMIAQEEWDDPAPDLPDTSLDGGGVILPSFSPELEMGRADDSETVFGITFDESDFMRFTSANDGSPGTIAALFLSRAIAAVHPDLDRPIRISMCINQRKALNVPLAHQCLVGGAWLEYKEKMRNWPVDRQVTCYRGMVLVQTQEERVLATQTSINRFTRKLLSLKADADRVKAAQDNRQSLKDILTGTVSYVGKANLGAAEKYIKSFQSWAYPMNESILLEISAVNHRIAIDFIQSFSNPVFFHAFLNELTDNGISFQHEYTSDLVIPGVRLPWSM